MRTTFLRFILLCILNSCSKQKQKESYFGDEFPEKKKKPSKGCNTWNTLTLLSYALLPDEITPDFHIKDGRSGDVLNKALIKTH